jgi:uncharacterized membrane protein YciS (DUF1049 family)
VDVDLALVVSDSSDAVVDLLEVVNFVRPKLSCALAGGLRQVVSFTHLLTKSHLRLLTLLTVNESRTLVVKAMQSVGLLVHKVAGQASAKTFPDRTEI